MRFSNALIYILNRQDIENVFGAIDDFLLLFEPHITLAECNQTYAKACAIFDSALGPNCRNTKAGKSQPPMDDVEFCGTQTRYAGSEPYIRLLACRPTMRAKNFDHNRCYACRSNAGARHANKSRRAGHIDRAYNTLWPNLVGCANLVRAAAGCSAPNKCGTSFALHTAAHC